MSLRWSISAKSILAVSAILSMTSAAHARRTCLDVFQRKVTVTLPMEIKQSLKDSRDQYTVYIDESQEAMIRREMAHLVWEADITEIRGQLDIILDRITGQPLDEYGQELEDYKKEAQSKLGQIIEDTQKASDVIKQTVNKVKSTAKATKLSMADASKKLSEAAATLQRATNAKPSVGSRISIAWATFLNNTVGRIPKLGQRTAESKEAAELKAAIQAVSDLSISELGTSIETVLSEEAGSLEKNANLAQNIVLHYAGQRNHLEMSLQLIIIAASAAAEEVLQLENSEVSMHQERAAFVKSALLLGLQNMLLRVKSLSSSAKASMISASTTLERVSELHQIATTLKFTAAEEAESSLMAIQSQAAYVNSAVTIGSIVDALNELNDAAGATLDQASEAAKMARLQIQNSQNSADRLLTAAETAATNLIDFNNEQLGDFTQKTLPELDKARLEGRAKARQDQLRQLDEKP